MSAPIFGVFFVGRSYPIADSNLIRTDATHWVGYLRLQCHFAGQLVLCTCLNGVSLQVLDVGAAVTRDYAELKEVALFLAQPQVLPPGQALGLYISVSGEWQAGL